MLADSATATAMPAPDPHAPAFGSYQQMLSEAEARAKEVEARLAGVKARMAAMQATL